MPPTATSHPTTRRDIPVPTVDSASIRAALQRRREQLERRLAGRGRPARSDVWCREEIDRALAWLEAGMYGRCTVCGKAIERDKLDRDPAAAACRSCERAQDNQPWLL